MANNACRPAELQKRLTLFGIAVCREYGRCIRSVAVSHVMSQLVRSATSPAANYGEAIAAESRRDFVHKLRICLKELRETANWLQCMQELTGISPDRIWLARECNELVSIFVASLKTLGRDEDAS
jgi:four helix bundle protein